MSLTPGLDSSTTNWAMPLISPTDCAATANSTVGTMSSSRTVIVWVDGAPRAPLVGVARVMSRVSSPSATASGKRFHSMVPLVAPAGMISGETLSGPSAGIVAVPPVVKGIVVGSSEALERSTAIATVPAPSATLEEAVAKLTIGGGSSSLIVRTCWAIVPGAAFVLAPNPIIRNSSCS